MSLSLLEIVASVERVHPRLNKELGPVTIADEKTVYHKPGFVLADDKGSLVSFQVSKSLDNAVRRYDGLVPDHQPLQLRRVRQLVLQGHVQLHDVGILVEEPDEFGIRV